MSELIFAYECVKNFFVYNGYTLELLLAVTIFAVFFERRRFFLLRFALSYGALLLFSILWNKYAEVNTIYNCIKYISMLSIAYIGVLVCMKTTLWSALFCAVGGTATQHCAFRIVSVILSFTHNGYDTLFAMFLNVIMIMSVYSMVFLVFRQILQYVRNDLFENRISIVLGLLLIISAVIMHIIEQSYGFMYTDPLLFMIFSIYGITCCIFSLGLQYSIFRSKKLFSDKAVLEHLIYKQQEQYKMSKENIDMINIKCHDMKQQISMFENRIDSKAIEEIKDIIKVYDNSFKTGNEVLDLFLSEKSLICERNNIKFNCIADGGVLSFMYPSEIYSLFGNALDNAIEALDKISDIERRIVTLTVKGQLNMAVIHMENYYAGELNFSDGLPRSTKENEYFHGFGMRSIRMIVEKYKGNMTISSDNGIFNLNIVIPLPDENQK